MLTKILALIVIVVGGSATFIMLGTYLFYLTQETYKFFNAIRRDYNARRKARISARTISTR